MQKYYLDDPSLGLIETVNIPAPTKAPSIRVLGFKNEPVAIDSSDYHACGCYISLMLGLAYVKDILSRAGINLTKWSVTNCLSAHPLAGQELNAYYDRHTLKYFYAIDPVLKKMIYLADSSDVVTHEMGHGILDVLRPDFWSVGSLEGWAFHESFADIIAILSIMQQDKILESALASTNGDLMKSSRISQLAEQVGTCLFHMMGANRGVKEGGLRDATIVFNYANPKTLPSNAPNNKLASESHSFGRVFLGAWFEVMVEIYKHYISKGAIPALKLARDSAAYFLFKGVKAAPNSTRQLEAIAIAMLSSMKQERPELVEITRAVFLKRNIIPQGVSALSAHDWQEIEGQIKNNDFVFNGNDTRSVRITQSKLLRIADHVASALSSGNPFYNVYMEVPSESFYESKGESIVAGIVPEESEIIDSAIAAADYINSNNYRVGADTMWTIKDGKLHRNFIT